METSKFTIIESEEPNCYSWMAKWAGQNIVEVTKWKSGGIETTFENKAFTPKLRKEALDAMFDYFEKEANNGNTRDF